MARRHVEDWLGPTIEAELESAIAWSRNALTHSSTLPKIKPDPDGPSFSDDGSNLRIKLAASQLHTVQLLKMLTLNEAATCLVSDGFTEIRATLGNAAVAALESELDEKLSLDVKNDVCQLLAATVIATPYGTPDARVHLAIDNLEYQYSLRKPVGQGVPVQERSKIATSVGRLTELRQQQLTIEEQEESGEAGPSLSQHASWSSSPPPVSIPIPVSAARQPQSLGSPSDILRKTQAVPATQISPPKLLPPRQRKQVGPSLDADGLELQAGINLSRPIGRAITVPDEPSPSAQRSPSAAAVRDRTAELAKVLGKRKQPDPSATPDRHPVQARALQSPTHRAKPTQRSLTDSSRVTSQPQSDAQPSAASSLHTVSNSAPAPSCACRPIPEDQQRLLDMKSSWWPAMPGVRFPHPNVPIALLEKWNRAQIKRSQVEEVRQPLQRNVTPSQSKQISKPEVEAAAAAPQTDGSDISMGSSGDDEELPPSQWSVSPTPKKHLPPDSSAGSPQGRVNPSRAQPAAEESTPVPSGEMETAVPRAYPDPSEMHRKKRSEWFRADQRRAWLKHNHTTASIKMTPLIRLMQAYKAAHPNDTSVSIESFDEALKEVFPEPSTPTTLTPTQPLPQGLDNLATQQQNTIPTEEPRESREHEKPNAEVQQPTVEEGTAHEQDVTTPFNEYALAWRSLQPGGAWARPVSEVHRQRPGRRSVNVFSWEL